MRAYDHGEVVAAAGSIAASVIHRPEGVHRAVQLLDSAEARAGVPLVDESERARLSALLDDPSERQAHWHSLLATTDSGDAIGYLGLDLSQPRAIGDVAFEREHHGCGDALHALLAAGTTLAAAHARSSIEVWVRHALEADVACAVDAGYAVARRLAVLERELPAEPAAAEEPRGGPGADGLYIRAFESADERSVVDVLALAYDGTDDGGWTPSEFRRRSSYDWFEPADLLVAERDGLIVGVHWTKRRGDGVGEVYNLAVHPQAQGSGLGAVLLKAGMTHLATLGCTRVILWVDMANERGLSLYARAGFRMAWQDLALRRHVAAS